MPNLAVHLEVLDQVIAALDSQGDPRAKLLRDNKTFAALGAMGPDLLVYLPVGEKLAADLAGLAGTSAPAISSLSQPELEELFFKPVGAAYSVLFGQVVIPAWPVLNKLTAFLDEADGVAQDENLLEVTKLIDQISSLIDLTNTLQTLKPTATSLIAVIGQITALGPWMELGLNNPLPEADPTADRLFEFLRWHRTGAFARELMKQANTDQERAFALGWLCHVATSVTAEPFVNNVTGGPYRTHWWRNRLVANFVDSWTFGFFKTQATMTGDEPAPSYDQWKPLCSANLQDEFNVANLQGPAQAGDTPDAVKAVAKGKADTLAAQFPGAIADFMLAAVNATYPAASQPQQGFSVEVFGQAVVGAFAVYWFMTSGSGPLCDNPVGAPPIDCTTAPGWITSGGAPSPQEAGLNVGDAICAVLLAILALFELLIGDFPDGLAALAAALSLPVIDWPTVRCNLFWLRKTLADAENGLRDGLVWGGLAYPPPVLLGAVGVNGETLPATDLTPAGSTPVNPPNGNVPTTSGIPLCRSNALSGSVAGAAEASSGLYPRALDPRNTAGGRADLNFSVYPDVGIEEPSTRNLIPANAYPNLVVDGTPLANGGMRTDGVYPSRYKLFGGATANAVDLIVNDAKGLPDYNLDGDRGYGWKTWNPKPGSDPASPPVHDEQES